MTPMEAKFASIGGTRQMIADDQFALLVAVLVDCGAVPANVMSAALRRLADQLIRKARGELATDWVTYPAECFDRARDLDRLAARLETPAAVQAHP
ncbi:MAG: hypothetical protein WBA88_05750 [Pseudaminobacter sp.]